MAANTSPTTHAPTPIIPHLPGWGYPGTSAAHDLVTTMMEVYEYDRHPATTNLPMVRIFVAVSLIGDCIDTLEHFYARGDFHNDEFPSLITENDVDAVFQRSATYFVPLHQFPNHHRKDRTVVIQGRTYALPPLTETPQDRDLRKRGRYVIQHVRSDIERLWELDPEIVGHQRATRRMFLEAFEHYWNKYDSRNSRASAKASTAALPPDGEASSTGARDDEAANCHGSSTTGLGDNPQGRMTWKEIVMLIPLGLLCCPHDS